MCIAAMLIHCKNRVTCGQIKDMCSAVMLSHCTNNIHYCKMHDMCIVVMLIRCKNSPTHNTINGIHMALTLCHCKNHAHSCKKQYYLYGANRRRRRSQRRARVAGKHWVTNSLPDFFCKYLETAMDNRDIQGGLEDPPRGSQQAAGHTKEAYNIDANSL